MSLQVTARPRKGGIVLPLEIGAVVDGEPITCQTPLSGHFSPVRAVVPIGARARISLLTDVLLDCPRVCIARRTGTSH
jgi:hypothetical protein